MQRQQQKKKFLILKIIGCIFAIALFIFALWFYPKYKKLNDYSDQIIANSSMKNFRSNENSKIYNVNNECIANLKLDKNTKYLLYDNIPSNVVNAFVSVEDKNFWKHKGIDLKGLTRVGVRYLLSKGQEKHGASTITQQVIKNIFLTSEVTMQRKVTEMFMAYKLEEKYSKEDIMEFYINNIYFGHNNYGIEAAANSYFHQSVKDLTLSQQAFLCAIPNSPTYYDPISSPDHTIQRRNKILKDMYKDKKISKQTYENAKKEKIKVFNTNTESTDSYDNQVTYAIDCATKQIMKRNNFNFQYHFSSSKAYDTYKKQYQAAYQEAKHKLYTGGYRIYTTLDPDKQKVLQKSIDQTLSFDQTKTKNHIYKLQGAGTLIDNETGKVVAIIGGRSQKELTQHSFNRAFQSYRQPGSAIKPILVYGPALDKGYKATSTLRSAIEHSTNSVATSVFQSIGLKYGLSYLEQMQFANIVPTDHTVVAALGGFTYGSTTTEMAGAYATFVNDGIHREVTCIKKMYDVDGLEVYKDDRGTRIYQQSTAKQMIDMMQGVITKGTAKSMHWNNKSWAAGKTGTTNESKDGWFCGMTKFYSLSIWVGYDTPKELSNLSGGTYPATIWKNAMKHYVP